jgi:2-polyprenyl-3-methyl-5-hydroxy-6-metoxy-1,4-benzoquinol methylase
VNQWLTKRFCGVDRTKIKIADIGCSVGLMAIEFAKAGFRSYGYDFDPSAVKIAKELAVKENVAVDFFEQDVTRDDFKFPIDMAICFDMFEHLHDDEIGVLLYNLKKCLSKNGCIIFHTLPLQYDYLFWDDKEGVIRLPFLLRIFRKQSRENFEKKVKIYALIIDILSIFRHNQTHKEQISGSGHPNPLTGERLSEIFLRAGYKTICLESGFLGESQFDSADKEYFYKQKITHRSLYGIITPQVNDQA